MLQGFEVGAQNPVLAVFARDVGAASVARRLPGRAIGEQACDGLRQAGFEVLSVHADDFKPPLGKGLWVDSSSFFGYRVGMFDIAPGRKRWELNARGRWVQRVANVLSPWLIAGGVLAVARRT